MHVEISTKRRILFSGAMTPLWREIRRKLLQTAMGRGMRRGQQTRWAASASRDSNTLHRHPTARVNVSVAVTLGRGVDLVALAHAGRRALWAHRP